MMNLIDIFEDISAQAVFNSDIEALGNALPEAQKALFSGANSLAIRQALAFEKNKNFPDMTRGIRV